ncbi:metalloregulator ArsR/SmtB family transcription factor [Spirosoma sp. KNUC1025]|uniref:ArsR/SmtB family transcription factor n=1 Tax=Spirosoma sp. KNUC1025 TaxID=2894082 RepID=UPI001E41C4B0|nr:metalloregulator ArsR/SmtB family transcription factor [Spirosoma sp. KNUC1025]UFH57994.1 metalloregulator ArsR/SmtB family transcription factor [Spirosoma sp. KNUC1025]
MKRADQKIAKAAELLKTIANSTRLKILLALAQTDALNVSYLQQQLQIEQSVLSHALIQMKDRDILARQRRGKEIYYSLADPAALKMILWAMNRVEG